MQMSLSRIFVLWWGVLQRKASAITAKTFFSNCSSQKDRRDRRQCRKVHNVPFYCEPGSRLGKSGICGENGAYLCRVNLCQKREQTAEAYIKGRGSITWWARFMPRFHHKQSAMSHFLVAFVVKSQILPILEVTGSLGRSFVGFGEHEVSDYSLRSFSANHVLHYCNHCRDTQRTSLFMTTHCGTVDMMDARVWRGVGVYPRGRG